MKRGFNVVRYALDQRAPLWLVERAQGFRVPTPDWIYDRLGLDWDVVVFPELWRWAVTLKFIICYALGRFGYAFESTSVSRWDWVFVAEFNHRSYGTMDGTMHDWNYCAVAPGWRDWRCDVGHDGT